jgi:hypothetical protein
MDDYVWPSSLDVVTQSGSESCIPEEVTEEEREGKKTVRFNEVVSQKTYRFVSLLRYIQFIPRATPYPISLLFPSVS